jgi:Outer membrane efflux protein
MGCGKGLTLLLIGLATIVAVAARAQAVGEVTVDELVARALTDNPDLKAARLEVEASAGRLQQAGLRPNPMLELGGQKALSPDNNLTVGVSLPLDLNGRKEGRLGVAEQEIETRRRQVAERERQVRAEVRMKAGELLAAQRNLQVTDDLLGVNRNALEVVGARVRQGAAPSLDEGLQLVEVNRLDASRQLAQSRVEIAGLQLKLLAGMAPDAPLALKGELALAPLPLDRADATQRAVRDRPDLAVARGEAAMAAAMRYLLCKSFDAFREITLGELSHVPATHPFLVSNSVRGFQREIVDRHLNRTDTIRSGARLSMTASPTHARILRFSSLDALASTSTLISKRFVSRPVTNCASEWSPRTP